MQAKRFISELSRIADHTSSSTFTVQQLRDIVKVYITLGRYGMIILDVRFTEDRLAAEEL